MALGGFVGFRRTPITAMAKRRRVLKHEKCGRDQDAQGAVSGRWAT
jgi:hypothetical protein